MTSTTAAMTLIAIVHRSKENGKFHSNQNIDFHLKQKDEEIKILLEKLSKCFFIHCRSKRKLTQKNISKRLRDWVKFDFFFFFSLNLFEIQDKKRDNSEREEIEDCIVTFPIYHQFFD